MRTISEMTEKRPWLAWVLFLITIIIVFLLGLLAASIVERRMEASYVNVPRNPVSQFEPRNEVWGENYPREYQSYYATADSTFMSKYNGNAPIDMLERHPAMVVMWAGYLFSADYTQARGHFYSLNDIRENLRTGAPMDPGEGPQPATCWTCKSPDVPRVMNEIGAAAFYSQTWAEMGPEIANRIGCADCHEAGTMNLTITRPALIEAFDRMGRDVNKSSHQDMRSLVCAQCHVEYYFDKTIADGAQYLVFPWDNGFTVEAMEAYYDSLEFADWTHALSRAPMLKAQHPDYEIYMTGIHARRGVSCADCHMPFMSEGGQKFTNHKMTSPLQNMSSSCQVCHREETDELIRSVYHNQDRVIETRNILEQLLVRAHVEAKTAWELGATEQQMNDILWGIRHAQWRWDYAAASHGASFHAPLETSRIIGNGITIAQETRLKLARLLSDLGHNEEIPYPDISTKAKAQEFIGLPMEKLHDDKEKFRETVLPEWDKISAERESSWGEVYPN
ncbi:MAG TPA: ammonia-forming cytochrome c nitrite reductase [Mariniphaga sp.]|nr:ammonia-forming cytochrome c nitrite reductase [Mariniphaga sp.]